MTSEDKRWVIALCVVVLAVLVLSIALNLIDHAFEQYR